MKKLFAILLLSITALGSNNVQAEERRRSTEYLAQESCNLEQQVSLPYASEWLKLPDESYQECIKRISKLYREKRGEKAPIEELMFEEIEAFEKSAEKSD